MAHSGLYIGYSTTPTALTSSYFEVWFLDFTAGIVTVAESGTGQAISGSTISVSGSTLTVEAVGGTWVGTGTFVLVGAGESKVKIVFPLQNGISARTVTLQQVLDDEGLS